MQLLSINNTYMKQNNFLKFFTVVFLFVGAITLNAQTIKGKVTDTSGEAL